MKIIYFVLYNASSIIPFLFFHFIQIIIFIFIIIVYCIEYNYASQDGTPTKLRTEIAHLKAATYKVLVFQFKIHISKYVIDLSSTLAFGITLSYFFRLYIKSSILMRTFQNKGIPVQLHFVVFNTSSGAIGVLGGSGNGDNVLDVRFFFQPY